VAEFTDWLALVASNHPFEAYTLLFLSAFVENLFPPVPGDTVTVFGAYLVGRGALALWPVIWATFSGSTLGFAGLFLLGRMLGRGALMRLSWVQRSGERLARAERLCRRRGVLVVVANRFLPGLRSVVSITVGLLRMPVWQVLPATMLSIFAWNGLLIWAGLLAGEHWQTVIAHLERYNQVFGGVLAAVGIFIGIWWVRRRKRRPPVRTPSRPTRS